MVRQLWSVVTQVSGVAEVTVVMEVRKMMVAAGDRGDDGHSGDRGVLVTPVTEPRPLRRDQRPVPLVSLDDHASLAAPRVERDGPEVVGALRGKQRAKAPCSLSLAPTLTTILTQPDLVDPKCVYKC
ncbi:hypothetical protein E2C01_054506 [Portunus trituberculatus]|uniref:Uncharacterized protein n=1 Tax=Portunus trituberculatus TaxID=210409 RepID=A0A5B7GJR8_PORTR|nr:hypothetical protein [Portunus trituberculatus]